MDFTVPTDRPLHVVTMGDSTIGESKGQAQLQCYAYPNSDAEIL